MYDSLPAAIIASEGCRSAKAQPQQPGLLVTSDAVIIKCFRQMASTLFPYKAQKRLIYPYVCDAVVRGVCCPISRDSRC